MNFIEIKDKNLENIKSIMAFSDQKNIFDSFKKTRFYAPIGYLNAVIKYVYDNEQKSFGQLYYVDIADDELGEFVAKRSIN